MAADSQVREGRRSVSSHDLEKQGGTFTEIDNVSGQATPPQIEEDGKLNFATIMAVYVFRNTTSVTSNAMCHPNC